MSGSLKICLISDELQKKLKQFRYRKGTTVAAIVLKIMKDTQELLVEEELEDCSIDELRESLPDQQPRFVLISYRLNHSDGRTSFPLCMVFVSPQGCNPEVQMLYAGSKNNLIQGSGVSKDFEIRDLEDLTSEFLEEKLKLK